MIIPPLDMSECHTLNVYTEPVSHQIAGDYVSFLFMVQIMNLSLYI